MMATSLEIPVLYVEGNDDCHTIIQLVGRHGIQLVKNIGPVLIKIAGNDTSVLEALRTAARAGTNQPVGFVIDANDSISNRWQAISSRLEGLGVELPSAPPSDGFVGKSTKLNSRVGVWIMPDNATDKGQLEHFVRTLVPPDDSLFMHAKESTARALELGAKLPPQDHMKAELYCWLAWQKEPGRPFGTAIKAHFFRHDSDVALRFVAWFKSLYRL